MSLEKIENTAKRIYGDGATGSKIKFATIYVAALFSYYMEKCFNSTLFAGGIILTGGKYQLKICSINCIILINFAGQTP